MNDTGQHSETVSWTTALAGVSVVIPAYDEENGIELTLHSIRDVFQQAGFENYEIVIIDDGSADRMAERARSAGARIVRHPHNVGYGRSLKGGSGVAGYANVNNVTDIPLSHGHL